MSFKSLEDNIVISVSNVSKQYQIYSSPDDRLKQSILPKVQRAFGLKPKEYCKVFCSLEDISFEVRAGETLGIVGSNGSGKSTLLQIICGTLSPTSGEVNVNGRYIEIRLTSSQENLQVVI
jgi:lipopolysaccharide transport system ATP-binding protein